ncbi:hypothetical protein KP509_14G093200 [Ceratopteris richardii]|uniref:Phospholipid/glycerol acyltransferase domain-containing protein n=1 Tax=Ceratopteris richardii TaxID=49495 RepID=A0A8T2TAD0_CERRI|nr:hypothetical protein KP509_14G093200 [Ceratopteris richardii]
MMTIDDTVSERFLDITNCPAKDRQGEAAVVSLNGCLLRSQHAFPYFMLLALEAGGPVRAFVLVLLCPLLWCMEHLFGCHKLAFELLIFVAMAGIRLSDVAGVSKAVLPKFFLEDMDNRVYRLLASCGRRYILTSYPTVMVEYFLKEHVGVDGVWGTELQVSKRGYCTGFVVRKQQPSDTLMWGKRKAEELRRVFDQRAADVGVGNASLEDLDYLLLCKEAYVVRRRQDEGDFVPREQYRKPLVFHDGRLVVLPTPAMALTYTLWLPFGLMLAVVRILITMCLPIELGVPCAALVGMRIRVKGAPPLPLPKGEKQGLMFVCTHRTLLDATIMCVGLRRKVSALTYSVSRFSEFISPIKCVPLTRDRQQDARLIGNLLELGKDVFVCPEGTTCREPYLLRFSSLFAELTEHIALVATRVENSMFWGTSARGYKALDPVFFLMNPSPLYAIMFLDRLRKDQTVAGGKTSVEVAKTVQMQLAEVLGFQCTEFTRKDKYTILAGNDGTVKDKRFTPTPSAAIVRGNDDDKSF